MDKKDKDSLEDYVSTDEGKAYENLNIEEYLEMLKELWKENLNGLT